MNSIQEIYMKFVEFKGFPTRNTLSRNICDSGAGSVLISNRYCARHGVITSDGKDVSDDRAVVRSIATLNEQLSIIYLIQMVHALSFQNYPASLDSFRRCRSADIIRNHPEMFLKVRNKWICGSTVCENSDDGYFLYSQIPSIVKRYSTFLVSTKF